MTDNFSENISSSYLPVFKQNKVPIFQNKGYASFEEALAAEIGEVELVQSLISGFIFNKTFAPHKMNYDAHYQNEQSNSGVFQDHLQSVLKLLISFGIKDKKLVEVGCGKGVFFEMMLAQGIDCWGFDPSYEGNNERIRKELFDETQKGMDADVIIMRHTLEHITHPFSFLHAVANANNYKGHLFIEVPTFDWIVSKNSFWDVFYEHCNYFTEESLCVMFDEATSGHFFGGQYIYLWAELGKIRETIPDDVKFVSRSSLAFDGKIKEYKNILNRSESFAVWGAGAKGSTFLNLLDKKRQGVKYVIDINPSKQNKFMAGTGHAIFDPSILMKTPVENILIMNENYKEEIGRQIDYFHVAPNIISL